VAARAGSGASRGSSRGTGAAAGGALALTALGKELAAGKLRRVYLLEGEELLIRREVLLAIENAALGDDPSTRAFGRQVFPGAETRVEDILAAAAGMPMFGGRRLVIVDGVDRLRKNDRELLLPALASVAETTVLVLIADKLDGRLTFTRDLRARTAVVPVNELPAAMVPRWIESRFQALGHAVAPAAARQLLVLSGPALSHLAGEIEKISLYVGAGKPVGLEDVNQVVAGGLGSTLDELVSAVGERDLPRALTSLARVLEAGEEPLRVLGFLNYRITDLWRLAAGHRGWVRDEVRAAARRWSAADLAGAIGALYAADRLLKGGEGGEGGMPLPRHRHGDALVLETLLWRILPERTPAPATPRGHTARPA
jgi:DNA polymerase-3 subunit delta